MKRSSFVILAVLAVAYVLIPILVPDPFFLRVASYIGVNVIVVLGLALLLGYSGQISMGHAAFVGLGAYTLAFCTVKLGLPWIVGTVLAVAIAALAGTVLAWPCLRLKGHYLAMATLGFGQIAVVAFNELKSLTGGPDGIGGIPLPSIGPLVFSSHESWFYLTWALVALCALIASRYAGGLHGLSIKAVRGSEQGAAAVGIDVSRTKVVSFTVSSAFAGLAGALYASIVGFISPSLFSLDQSIRYLAMAVLGGPYSLIGPSISSFVLTAIQYVEAFIPGIPKALASAFQAFETDIFGIAIILTVLFAPQGIKALRIGRARKLSGGEER